MEKSVLLGLTTTPESDWRGKIAEIKKFEIKEIALFPTYLTEEERRELYKLLAGCKLDRIPHVHLRDDMAGWEMDLLADDFGTEVFNCHANEKSLRLLEYKNYCQKIYFENQFEIDEFFLANLDRCGGICLDVSHWEDQGVIQKNEGYDKFRGLLEKYKVGCSHVSGIKNEPDKFNDYLDGRQRLAYSFHWLDNLSELGYVEKYRQYLPRYVSIELENSFAEQLLAKDYLEKLIKS